MGRWWNPEALIAAVIGTITTALVWATSPGERRKAAAASKASTADATEKIVSAAGEVLDIVRAQMDLLQAELVEQNERHGLEIEKLTGRVDKLEAENVRLTAENKQLRDRLNT